MRITRKLQGVCLASLLAASACTNLQSSQDTANSLHLVGSGGSAPGTGGSAGNGGSTGMGGSGSPGGGGAGGNVNPADWGCLASPHAAPQPPAADAGPAQVVYLVPVVDFNAGQNGAAPVAGLSVKACSVDDADCMNPIMDPSIAIAASPASKLGGPLQALPPYFIAMITPYDPNKNFFLRLEAKDYVTTHYFLGGPMTGSPDGGLNVRGLPIPLLTISALQRLYSDINIVGPIDTTKGILAVRALNCNRDATMSPPLPTTGVRAEGVTIELSPVPPDPPSRSWSLNYSNIATSGPAITDPRGVAGFANLEPVGYTVRGITPFGGGTPYSTPVTVRIRPNVITIVEVRDGVEKWGQ